MNKKMREYIKNINIFDWCLLAILVTICFFSFEHLDIVHTGSSSISYLNGHIMDFYEYTATKLEVNNYLPTTYIIYAVWNIPIRIIGLITEPSLDVPGIVRMWYKLLPSIFYLMTTILIYKIFRMRKMNEKNSFIAAFMFASSPIAVYSQFIFSQYDIITTFFVVLGLYFYMQKKDKSFIASFAIAITCKYFALLIFVPLLLLREKKIWKIIIKCMGVGSLFVIETLFYISSQAFKTGVFGFFATNYMFQNTMDVGYAQISIVVLVWAVVCAWAYFKDCSDNDEEFKIAINLINIVAFAMFGLSCWHPQWLILGVPFWTIGIILNKKRDAFILLDTVLFGAFVMYGAAFWKGGTDLVLFHWGAFKSYIENKTLALSMSDIYHITDSNLLFSVVSAILLIYAIFNCKKNMDNESDIDLSKCKGLIRVRYIGGILFFIIPAFICLLK